MLRVPQEVLPLLAPRVREAVRLRAACRGTRRGLPPPVSPPELRLVLSICGNLARQCNCGGLGYCGMCHDSVPAAFAEHVLRAPAGGDQVLGRCFEDVLVDTFVTHLVLLPRRYRALYDYRVDAFCCDCFRCHRTLPCGRGSMRPWTPAELGWLARHRLVV